MKSWKACGLVTCFEVTAGIVNAAESQMSDKSKIQEAFEANATHVSGRDEPDRIPFRMAMGFFCEQFDTVHAHVLSDKLTRLDVEKIRLFKKTNTEKRKLDARSYKAQRARMCLQVDSISPGALAAELKSQDKAHNAKQNQRYLELLDNLSAAGRQTIANYLRVKVAPTVTYVKSNEIPVWNEFPKEMSDEFRATCNANPEDVQRKLTEAIKAQSTGSPGDAERNAANDDFQSPDEPTL